MRITLIYNRPAVRIAATRHRICGVLVGPSPHPENRPDEEAGPMDGMSWNELTERLKGPLTPSPAVLSIGGLLFAAIIDHYAHGDIATELLYVPPLLVLPYLGGGPHGF